MALPQIAVGAVVIDDERLLMVRRRHDPGAGLWSLPGGRLEHGEYLADAVRREVLEETGIDVEVEDLVGILEVTGDPHYVILDFAATARAQTDPEPRTDAVDARWVPLKEVAALDCTPRFVETLRGWGIPI